MNPIELGKAIAEDGIAIITAVMLILVVGLVWYLIKRQTKREDKHDKQQENERLFYRELVKNDLKDIHRYSEENARLNKESIAIVEKHNGNSEHAWKRIHKGLDTVCTSLINVCDRLNGGSPTMVRIKKELDGYKKKDRRRGDKKVEVDRRK